MSRALCMITTELARSCLTLSVHAGVLHTEGSKRSFRVIPRAKEGAMDFLRRSPTAWMPCVGVLPDAALHTCLQCCLF